MMRLSCVLCVCVWLHLSVAATVPEVPVNPKTVVHVYGEEHFLKECSFESATVKSVYPSLKAPIFQLLQQPLFLLVKTSDRANAVFLPQGLSTPESHPPVSPSIDTMLRSYEERHSLVFSLAHFPFKHFKEVTLGDFLTNGKSLKQGVPLTDIPVMAFYTKHELDELKPFFKFFYMGDLEVTANSVAQPNRKSSMETAPAMPVPMQAGYNTGEGYKSVDGFKPDPVSGYPYANRLPSSHPQKHAFFLAPVPVILPQPKPQEHHHDGPGQHNILNRSPSVQQESRGVTPGDKTAADLPVYSYKGVPLYIPRGRQQSPSSTVQPTVESPSGQKSYYPGENSAPAGISSTESPGDIGVSGFTSPGPQPYSLPSGLGGTEGVPPHEEHVSLVFPSSPAPRPQPYSLPAGYGGVNERK
ncbi:hypothetical protein M8J76_010232 [Diaphorina citri]|nr:hypothetical protein M8J75_014591 [Diaphorina citri]KAI5745340.1 hypothetical protein M8J76_010232 [Diaphorina citri]